MGVYYSCHVFPDVASMAFTPDSPCLSAIMDLLIDLRWAARADYYKAVTGSDQGELASFRVHEASRLEDLGRLLEQKRGFALPMPAVPDEVFWPDGSTRADGRSRKYDLEDDPAGLLRAEHCDGVTLICSPLLCSVPADAYNGTPVPCPRCRSDVLSELEPKRPESRGLRYAGVTHSVPASCGACGADLSLQQLAAEMRSGITGELIPEIAPFARFMIDIQPAAKADPPSYPHPLDEQLLAGLKGATGVASRHVGRWS